MGTDPLLLIVSFVIVLVPLIFFHELGHFVMAKLVGITVLEFGIGFPPRMVRLFKRGDTEYTLNWIPLGGFVRPLGEDLVGPKSEQEAGKDRDAYARQRPDRPAGGVAVNDVSPRRRILFMAGGPLFNVMLAVLLFAAAQTIGAPVIDHSDITVTGLAWDSPALRAGLRPGDIIRAADGQAFSFASELAAYLAQREGAPLTLTVERVGQALDLELAEPGDLGARLIDAGAVRISAVNAGSPAEEYGVLVGDIVRAVRVELPYPTASLGVSQMDDSDLPVARALDNDAVYTSSGLAGYVRAWQGAPVTFSIEREGLPFRLTVPTRDNPPAGEGATGTTIETRYPMAVIKEPLPQALLTGVERTINVVGLTLSAPAMLLRGEISGEEARPVGIVGISQLGGQFLEESVQISSPSPLLQFAAVISVALGLTNLLPLPALDGGRILFVIVEMIRGRPMDPAREGMIHLIGLVFLLGLMFVLLFADILHPIQLP